MDSKKLCEISENARKKLFDKVLTNTKNVDKLLKKSAECGLNNAFIICEASKIREFEQDAIRRGLKVYAYINEDNNGQLDVEWS